MNLFGLISELLLLFIVVDALYNYLRGHKNTLKQYISYSSWILGIIITLKFLFNIKRSVGYDPFAFPSLHSALSILPLVVHRNPIYIIYTILICSMRVAGNYHNIIDTIAGILFAAASILIFKYLEKKGGKEVHRKSLHLGISIFLGLILYINRLHAIILMIVLLIIGIILYRYRHITLIKDLLNWYDRDFNGKGAFTLVGGLLVVSLLWNLSYISAFYLGWVDSLPTIFRSIFKVSKKDIRGLIGGFLGSLVVFFTLKTNIILTLIVPLVEYILPKEIDDNLIIPLVPWIFHYIPLSL